MAMESVALPFSNMSKRILFFSIENKVQQCLFILLRLIARINPHLLEYLKD
jgi:hypothetical protein